jgi:NAD(P)-dependent dehydrogenase (short-subunit alcohol dehydrogenase family)
VDSAHCTKGGGVVSFEGKVAIVTGAGRGIGAAIARELGRRGTRVIVNDLGVSVDGHPEDECVAERTVSEIAREGGEAVGHVGDASDVRSAQQAVQLALQRWGRLDILVNNAGTLRVKPIWEMSEDDWDSVLRSHARHTYAVTHQACCWWRQEFQAGHPVSGRIVNLTAATGLLGRPDMGSNHAAAKGAIAAFTMVVAQEMFDYGVTVNAVSPAAVRTRMASHVGAHLPEASDGFDPANPENVAPLVVYLASDRAGWITGQVFRLVGGVIGWYRPWSVVCSISQDTGWSVGDLDLGLRRLLGTYPGGVPRS